MTLNAESLEDAMRRAGGAVPLLRNSTARPHTFPVTAAFSNWRSGRGAQLHQAAGRAT